jgi:hypothetical protein
LAQTAYVSQALTVNGGSNGLITVASTSGFQAGLTVYLSGTALATQELLIDSIVSGTTLYVKPKGYSYTRFDASAYTLAASARITQPEQEGYTNSTPSSITNGTISGTLTFTTGSGSNALVLSTGARIDMGGGANDYIYSDGTAVAFGGGIVLGGGITQSTGNTALSTVTVSNFLVSNGIFYARGNTITDDNNSTLVMNDGVADGAAAIAFALNSTTSLATAGAKILAIRNNTVEKFAIDKDGKFIFPGGAGAVAGTATLVAGTVIVNTTAIRTGDKIFVSHATPGGTIGIVSAPTASIVNGTSFVINSSAGTDTSTVNWIIVG